MATALAQLSTLLDSLQSRVAELEKRAGVPAGSASVSAAAVGGAGAGAAASDDDEPTGTTREFDALVAKFGEELEKVSKDIGGDVAVIVSSCKTRTLLADAAGQRPGTRVDVPFIRRRCGARGWDLPGATPAIVFVEY